LNNDSKVNQSEFSIVNLFSLLFGDEILIIMKIKKLEATSKRVKDQ